MVRITNHRRAVTQTFLYLFVQSYLVTGRPAKLLFIATGNISNQDLEKLIRANLAKIVLAFEDYHFIEIGQDVLAFHE